KPYPLGLPFPPKSPVPDDTWNPNHFNLTVSKSKKKRNVLFSCMIWLQGDLQSGLDQKLPFILEY
ncbi:MAG: hypothetical protein K8R17_03955, partial [Methanosarcinales archaeon]|nr:hypothetical protein [Methanosarcinales archaeon]